MKTILGAALTVWEMVAFAQLWVAGEFIDHGGFR